MNIGENIHRYRREAGLTQEALGECVGVSMQAVSKWENGGVPDALLLPAIADALGVSVDALFGRGYSEKDTEAALAQQIFDGAPCLQRALELIFTMHRASFGEAHFSKEDTLAQYRDCHSQYIHENGLSLMQLSKKADYAFIAPRPEGGWAQAIVNREEQVKLFSLLGQADAFDTLIFLHSHGAGPFTIGYFTQETGLPQEKAQQLLAVFGEYDLVHAEKVAIDDRTEVRYTVHQNPAVVPLLAFSLELIRRPNVFNYYRADHDPLL